MSEPLVLTVLPAPPLDSGAEVRDTIDDVLGIARRAEDAGLDGLFLADSLAFDPSFSPRNRFEPVSLAAAVLARTERITVVATLSTTFTHPVHVTRHLTSLSHIGAGRIAANLVTSYAGEQNFGLDELPPPAQRYARAGEYLDVVDRLWHSWGEKGDDPADIDFTGEHFTVRGPLSIRPFPGPLLVGQSGASPAGIDLAARVAEFVFTSAPADHAQRRYTDALTRACATRRTDGTRPTVLTGLAPILGDTAEQAREHERALAGAFSFAEQRARIEEVLGGVDLSDVAPDDPFPRDRLPAVEDVGRRQGRAAAVHELVTRNDLTLAEVVRIGTTANGHRSVVGTADTVAEEIARIAGTGLTDGFIVLLPKHSELVDRVFEELFPRLGRAGLLVRAPDADRTRSRFLRR
ncbi:NtaA/DmoA family FMN-dependent monooxygenase [Pseudonocardia ailaonensis]|uniref:NtaA/DmoA family FMN-dependent monooxygenase n=1 Tax=Pseudonocardia ailaonensis TaxID=367279 RepID=A0ABN2MGG3_9PSEU